MTTSKLGQSARHIRRQPVAHRFAVGQLVRLKNGYSRTLTPAAIYHVTGMLPPRDNSPQYRIRNDEERHERVTTQDDLEPVNTVQPGASLIERTFTHG